MEQRFEIQHADEVNRDYWVHAEHKNDLWTLTIRGCAEYKPHTVYSHRNKPERWLIGVIFRTFAAGTRAAIFEIAKQYQLKVIGYDDPESEEYITFNGDNIPNERIVAARDKQEYVPPRHVNRYIDEC